MADEGITRTSRDATGPASEARPGRPGQGGDAALARAEAELERTRERVAQSMLALRNEVARRTDWRRMVRERPLLFMGAALALGFWWGFRRGAAAVRGRARNQ